MDTGKSKMMITALAWVKRGYAKAVLEEFDDEMQDVQAAKASANQAFKEEIKEGEGKNEDEFNMKDYDKEDYIVEMEKRMKDDNAEGEDAEGDLEMDDKYPMEAESDEEEKEDLIIRKSDALIVTAAAEQEYSNLEVYLFEEENSNLFIHHEIMLNAYPLALEWLPYAPGKDASFEKKGNFIAVATFTPNIEIWNLDVVNSVEPYISLGGETAAAANVPLSSLKKKNKQKYFKEGSHLDAVLCLSAHPTQPNILASGSSDKTIKIWDLSTEKCIRTIKNHKDKVQVIQWNPHDDKSILSAGFDRKAVVCNTKNTNEKVYIQFNTKEEGEDIESG